MITYTNLGKNGEFGNQLFQISAVIGTALKHNTDFNFPKWKGFVSQTEYSKYFKNPIPETLNSNQNFIFYSEPSFSYNEIPYLQDKNIDLFGYFQSEKYFSHCKEEIKKYFEPSDLILNKIKNLDYSNSVCLQLRFYDSKRSYGKENNNSCGDPSYGDIYYTVEENIPFLKNAINYFGKNKNYLVSTNNYEKAKAMFSSYSNFIFLEEYSYLERFFIQTLCEHNIITNSTFGWWGAWLNKFEDNTVFAPINWFKPNFKQKEETKDLYPTNWRVL